MCYKLRKAGCDEVDNLSSKARVIEDIVGGVYKTSLSS